MFLRFEFELMVHISIGVSFSYKDECSAYFTGLLGSIDIDFFFQIPQWGWGKFGLVTKCTSFDDLRDSPGP